MIIEDHEEIEKLDHEKNKENQENKEKEKINKIKEMRTILEYTLNKFKAFRNSMTFTGIFYTWYYIFPNKKLTNHYEIIFEYASKLQKQFDVFYYMHQHKKLNLIEEIMFNPTEKKLINLISKKYYRVSLNEKEQRLNRKSTRIEKSLETNEELIDYVLNNKDCEMDSKEELLIRYLIK